MSLPLEGILVLEFCQYMAGPSAGLRLADLGARVIKIERPKYGEGCRQLAIRNLFADGDSLVFHTVNRNKESYAADLKNADDLAKVKMLIKKADVLTHNFRPGIMEKLGLDYNAVQHINPKIIYGEVSGYGKEGPWKDKPGQDLLLQSLTGLTWLSGNADKGPVPMGVAVVDILCGTHFTHGIMAALIQRGKTGKGARVEVSLLASAVDFQFEVLTAYLNDGNKLPQRSSLANGHAYLSAPYGIHKTKDGYIALAMGSLPALAKAMASDELNFYADGALSFSKRDEIKKIIAKNLLQKTTKEWLSILEPTDTWCSNVFSYADLMQNEGYQLLGMEQTYNRHGEEIKTTRCPIRINGERLYNAKPSPRVGEHNKAIEEEFIVNEKALQ